MADANLDRQLPSLSLIEGKFMEVDFLEVL